MSVIGPTELCPEGIELVLLDLDDTVLVDGTKVTPRVIDTINLARERGCMVAVATGRAYHMVTEALRRPAAMDYLICANGARVHDTIGGLLMERLMTREQVLEAMDIIDPLGPGWNAFIGNHTYFEWRGFSYMLVGRAPLEAPNLRKSMHTGAGVNLRGLGRKARKMARFGKRMVFNREGISQVWRVRPHVESCEDDIVKLGCSLPSKEACERAIAALEYLGCFEVARMSPTELEITAKGATKGTAAQWLMNYLKVDPSRVVAFGDSENDAPLAEVCGTFVAMANSDASVKELADDVCESVYDDGVARWLERAMAEADGAKHV